MKPLRALLLAAAAAAAASCASNEAEKLGAETYLHNAQGYAEGGHHDQALDQFRRALELDPGNRKALLGEATCLYWLGSGETQAAGRTIQEAEEKASALDPDDFGNQAWKVRLTSGMIQARLAELWTRKAAYARAHPSSGETTAQAEVREAEEAAARHDRAAVELLVAVLAEEDEPLARNNLTALVLLASRSALRASTTEGYDEALGFFRRYEAELKRSKSLWVAMKKQQPDMAEIYDRKLRGAEAQEVGLRDLMANILFKRKEHEASISELDQVLAIDPRRSRAWLARAQNNEELGRWGDAADDYRRFLELTDLPPGNSDLVRAVDRMAVCERKARGDGTE